MPSSRKSEKSSKIQTGNNRSFPEEFFERSLSRGRLSHAYLFLGPDISGIAAFCRRLACRLFCKSGCPPGEAACAVCARLESDNHPDYYYLRPPQPGAKVLIDLTREIRRAVNMSRFEAPYKIVAIEHAELMTEAAQNQMLKTLEEPPDAVVILLIAPATTGLLPTVVSRCVPVRFPAATEDEIRLEVGADVGDDEAAWLARAASGNGELAGALLRRGAYKLNDEIIEALSNRREADWAALSDMLLNSGAGSESASAEKRWWLRLKFDVLASILRDALFLSLDIKGARLYNADKQARIRTLATAFSSEEILETLAYITESQAMIESNLNAEIICDCLAQRLLIKKREQ